MYFALISIVVYLIFFIVTKVTKKKFISKGFILSSGISLFLTLIVVIYGFVSVNYTYYVTYEVNKDSVDRTKIVLLSDIHLGYTTTVEIVDKMVSEINALEPEIVVFAGDIFENEFDSLDNKDQVIEAFRSIKSVYGVFGGYGNHDSADKLISGFTDGKKNALDEDDARMAAFFASANIHMLEDEAILINDSFYLVGRKDLKRSKTLGINRMSIDSLTSLLVATYPKVIIDHEPEEFEEYNGLEGRNISLVLSGHTHNGQLFPANIVTSIQFENNYGIKTYQDITFITTQGYGTWGPRMRVGTRTEIATIDFGV